MFDTKEEPFLPLHLPIQERYDLRSLTFSNDDCVSDEGPFLFGYLPQKTKQNLEDSARWRAENQMRRRECEHAKLAHALDRNRY